MLKLTGLTGIVIAFGLSGILKAQQLKLRIILLEDFMQTTLELKGRISYFKEPLPSVFGKVDKRNASKASELLSAVEERISDTDGGIREIWEEEVNHIYRDAPLTPEDIEAIKYMGNFIGQTNYENHLFHFSYLEEKLACQISESKANFKIKGPMYRKIGFFIGAVFAILFI